MDGDEPGIAALRAQIAGLESRIATLEHDLRQAVALIDRYGETLGRHMKLLRSDQAQLSRRLEADPARRDP